MRLWHQNLISLLPKNQLLGQNRECCALRGNGWGRKHATVNYVFSHSPYRLFEYHSLIMKEMRIRGYKTDKLWYKPLYRGKICEQYTLENLNYEKHDELIYQEHDEAYMQECLDNLKGKGIMVNI